MGIAWEKWELGGKFVSEIRKQWSLNWAFQNKVELREVSLAKNMR